ncbi:hypothetical protein, partial [Haliangium sp.]|uniref:hypothetical protein n=1 Tax=Haliangium sp. TaxID=2663208 RepID=UPI003D0AD5C5
CMSPPPLEPVGLEPPPRPPPGSPFHELVVELLRAAPGLLLRLFRIATRKRRPPGTSLCEADLAFSGWSASPMRADLVRTFQREDGKVERALVFEVQLSRDGDKRFSWPFYLAAARARWRCSANLIVLTLDRTLAAWCARPIPLDDVINEHHPVVVGPDDIPVVTDLDMARRCPELAVLSAVVHSQGPQAIQVARAALLACTRLDKAHACLYHDFVISHLSPSGLAAVKDLMLLEGYEYQSEFARKHHQEGLDEGLAHERATLSALLTTQIEARFGPLSDSARERVQDADTETLVRWGAGLLSAASVDELLAS